MNVPLTPELEQFVQDKIDSGLYHSVSEVIWEGLRLLQERDMFLDMKLQALRAEIQKVLTVGNQRLWIWKILSAVVSSD